MAKKISKTQREKVLKMIAFLDTETGLNTGIQIESDLMHMDNIQGMFLTLKNVYFFGPDGAKDMTPFSDVHAIYTAALKDPDFKAYNDQPA